MIWRRDGISMNDRAWAIIFWIPFSLTSIHWRFTLEFTARFWLSPDAAETFPLCHLLSGRIRRIDGRLPGAGLLAKSAQDSGCFEAGHLGYPRSTKNPPRFPGAGWNSFQPLTSWPSWPRRFCASLRSPPGPPRGGPPARGTASSSRRSDPRDGRTSRNRGRRHVRRRCPI